MLARTFKSAAELGICEREYNALCNVHFMIEDGVIKLKDIDMSHIHGCGTAHCLAGWANTIDPGAFPELTKLDNGYMRNPTALPPRLPKKLNDLFGFGSSTMAFASAQAGATALRKYLETATCR